MQVLLLRHELAVVHEHLIMRRLQHAYLVLDLLHLFLQLALLLLEGRLLLKVE